MKTWTSSCNYCYILHPMAGLKVPVAELTTWFLQDSKCASTSGSTITRAFLEFHLLVRDHPFLYLRYHLRDWPFFFFASSVEWPPITHLSLLQGTPAPSHIHSAFGRMCLTSSPGLHMDYNRCAVFLVEMSIGSEVGTWLRPTQSDKRKELPTFQREMFLTLCC